MQRYQHGISCDQAIQGQQTERRRTVDQHIVELGHGTADCVTQQILPPVHIDQFEFRRRQIHGRGDDGEAGYGGVDQCLVERDLTEQQIVGAGRPPRTLNAEAGRRIALGIQIDHQHTAANCRQRGREINRRGGLANPAFLIGDRDYPPRSRMVCPRRVCDRLITGLNISLII